MFKVILIFLLSFNCLADDWTRQDTYRESAYLALHALDWNMTLQISKTPNLQESNPILGTNPNAARINEYMAGSALLQFGIAYVLPSEYRKAFQYITIGDSLHSVATCYSVGLKFKF